MFWFLLPWWTGNIKINYGKRLSGAFTFKWLFVATNYVLIVWVESKISKLSALVNASSEILYFWHYSLQRLLVPQLFGFAVKALINRAFIFIKRNI